MRGWISSAVVASAFVVSPVRAGETAHELVTELNNLACPYGVGAPPEGRKPPKIAIADKITIAPESYEDVMGGWGHHGYAEHAVVGATADSKAAWIAADLTFGDLCGMPQCQHDPPVALAHGTALFEASPAGWQPVAWDFARILTGKELAGARRTPPAAITRAIEPGADDAVHDLEAALGDPAMLAKLVSDRADTVLHGSDLRERFVGGAAVRAQLVKWRLAYKIRDGVLAGLTASKSAAWIVANVDAARPGDKLATYRLFAICEKAAGRWRIVQLSFSIPSPGSAPMPEAKLAKLSPQELRTCKSYAACRVERRKDDDPKAEARQPAFLAACLDVWVGLKSTTQTTIASCADRGGECGAVLPCFDSMNLKP